jgi:hypothetical protein
VKKCLQITTSMHAASHVPSRTLHVYMPYESLLSIVARQLPWATLWGTVVVGGTAVGAGCAAAPVQLNPVVTVLEARTPYELKDGTVRFRVTVEVANSTERSVRYLACGLILEQRVGKGWRMALSELCLGDISGAGTVITPSNAARFVVMVGGSVLPNILPRFVYQDSIPGEYRLVLNVVPDDSTGRAKRFTRRELTSNGFVVTR